MSQIGAQRTARIRAIHATCRAQGIDNETRHAIALEVIGKASTAEMNVPELGRLLDHLNKQSAAPADEWRFVFRMAPERQSYARKIYRLAQRVGKAMQPPVPVASKAYIEGITRQMRGTEQPLEFCDCAQLHKIIQALEIHLKRL